jgi:hypothetical protein
MNEWRKDELSAIADAVELGIATRGPEGTYDYVPIWVVRVGNSLYLRSYEGPPSGWFLRATNSNPVRIQAAGLIRDVTVASPDADVQVSISRAYRAKYGRFGESYVGPMVGQAAIRATLRLLPR